MEKKPVSELVSVKPEVLEKRLRAIQGENLLVLEEFRGGYKDCHHNVFVVDEAKDLVECKDCGALLNPMWCMVQLVRRQSRWKIEYEAYRDALIQYENKKRTKYEHCGRFTNINIK